MSRTMNDSLPRWFLSAAIVLGGCAKGTIAMPQDQPYQPSDDDDGGTGTDTGDDPAPGTTSSGTETVGPISEGWDGSSSGSAGTSAMITDSVGAEETGGSGSGGGSSSTTAPTAQQPATGWWSHCTSNAECDGDLLCVLGAAPDDGYCASACTPLGDATSCGGTTDVGVPSCFTHSGVSLCALDCSMSACPSPMNCVADMVDSGPIQICI